MEYCPWRVFWEDRMQLIFGFRPGEFDGTFEGLKKGCIQNKNINLRTFLSSLKK